MLQVRWVSAAIVVCFLAGTVRAQEEKVPVDKLPNAVTAAVKKRYPNAEITAGSKEPADGKTVYEVSVKEKGHNIDITVTAEGTITTMEKTIDEKDLPKPVAAALKAKYPGVKYEILEAVIHVKDGKESLDYYEALLVTADKKKYEAEFAPDGKFMKETEKKAGDKD
jgi:hypothetical protein